MLRRLLIFYATLLSLEIEMIKDESLIENGYIRLIVAISFISKIILL